MYGGREGSSHCALRQMRNGTLQWNTAMELTVNGRSQWKPAANGIAIEAEMGDPD